MLRSSAIAVLGALAASAAHAGTPGTFTVFNDIPQFGIYSTTAPNYTPPNGVYLLNYGTEYLTRLTPAERGAIGADVSANVTYLAQCDNYDRIGGLFMIVKPHGVAPVTTDTQIELMRWITPFSDYTQGTLATHAYPAASLAAFQGILRNTAYDIWIGLAGGSNPYSGDPCSVNGKSADYSAIGFSYTVSFSSTQPATSAGGIPSAPVPVADYTATPITGTASSPATGAGTALVIVSGHGSSSGGDEYRHTVDTLTLNGTAVGSFNTQANCSAYAKYSPDGNPGIFVGNNSYNPRNWCPGALVPTHSVAVTLGASNTAALSLSNPAVPSGSYYDTSITLIPN